MGKIHLYLKLMMNGSRGKDVGYHLIFEQIEIHSSQKD